MLRIKEIKRDIFEYESLTNEYFIIIYLIGDLVRILYYNGDKATYNKRIIKKIEKRKIIKENCLECERENILGINFNDPIVHCIDRSTVLNFNNSHEFHIYLEKIGYKIIHHNR